jgi:hypothetical protein
MTDHEFPRFACFTDEEARGEHNVKQMSSTTQIMLSCRALGDALSTMVQFRSRVELEPRIAMMDS